MREPVSSPLLGSLIATIERVPRLMRLVVVCGLAWMGPATSQAQHAGYEYQEGEVVESAVDEVMSRPEFRRLREMESEERANPAWLERLLDWIAQWFETTPTDEESTGWPWLGNLGYGVALLVVIGAIALILKSVLESAHESELADERGEVRIRADVAPGETAPEEFWMRAHELAAAGNEKLAIRELLIGAMSALERGGRIRYRRGLTNRDYLWAATGDARASLATIIDVFERVYFGRRVATPEGFDACADAYRQSFRGAP